MALSDVQSGRIGEYLLAPDFNRLTTHSPARGVREVELHFRAFPERYGARTW